jgi:hypothetical protein
LIWVLPKLIPSFKIKCNEFVIENDVHPHHYSGKLLKWLLIHPTGKEERFEDLAQTHIFSRQSNLHKTRSRKTQRKCGFLLTKAISRGLYSSAIKKLYHPGTDECSFGQG